MKNLKHIEKVVAELDKANGNSEIRFLKEIKSRVSIKTYQELYKESQMGEEKYKLSNSIISFYHLDE